MCAKQLQRFDGTAQPPMNLGGLALNTLHEGIQVPHATLNLVAQRRTLVARELVFDLFGGLVVIHRSLPSWCYVITSVFGQGPSEAE